MPGWIENRIYALEQRVEYILRLLQDLQQQVLAAQQNALGAYAQYQPAGGGGWGGVFFCLPTTLGPASGSWPALTPGSQSLTVYQVSGSTITSTGTQTVYNWMPSAVQSNLVLMVLPDGSGAYVAANQSCS